MEFESNEKETCIKDSSTTKNDNSFIITSSNWKIDNNKSFNDCISTVSLLEAPVRINLEDIAFLDTSIALKSCNTEELCKFDLKIINKQKIARIALASEASVLEFYKESGEYATTVFAEFVDEFQDHSVYFAEATIQPPSSEATIKFIRTKNKSSTMWIYGIKLVLTESMLDSSDSMFNLDVINDLIINMDRQNYDKIERVKKVIEFSNENNTFDSNMSKYLQKMLSLNLNTNTVQTSHEDTKNNQHDTKNIIGNTECNNYLLKDVFDLKVYIDNKFLSLEKLMIEQLECMDKRTNQKLDKILQHLQSNVNNQ